MSTSKTLRANPRNAVQVSDDDYLIFCPATGRLHRLNGTAALLYELSDGTRTADELSSLVTSIPGQSRKQCWSWLGEALANCLLLEEIAGVETDPDPQANEFSVQAGELRDEGLILAAFVCQAHACRLNPQRADFWLELGELAHILGRRRDSRDAYEQVVTLRPDNQEARHILRALRDEAPPDRAPDECIRQLYGRFSTFYEENMCGDLEYEAPERLRELLAAHLNPEPIRKVLELGCGTGLSGKILRPYARTLTGIDLSPEMVEHCRLTGYYEQLIVAEITAFLAAELARGSGYDLIAACDTLIYFGDLKQVLNPVARLLSTDGHLAFTVEKGHVSPFNLTDSGRFAHHIDYIRQAGKESGLELVELADGFLRYEYGEPVDGLSVLMQKQG